MNKTSIALSAFTLALAATTQAQEPPGRFAPPTTSKGLFGRKTAPAAKSSDARRDPNVMRTGEAVPEPVAFDQIEAPKIARPAEPIEPFLLQKENGPFMVSAHTFTGPDAAMYAQILAMEIRREYHLPAYVWLARVQPSKSNIQGVQPTAPAHARNGDMSPPEKLRTYDEAAVLVGDCKTIDESKKLLTQVKKLRPRCIDTFPVIFQNRRGKGLNRAMLTTNPFAASQHLFPGGAVDARGLPVKQGQAFDPFVAAAAFENARKPTDPVVKRMNVGSEAGPNSIARNPGKYTLQVAEFTGRSAMDQTSSRTYDEKLSQVVNRNAIKQSPLMSAVVDAEELAVILNKCKNMKGLKAYVYHTRSSSIVTIGAFNGPNDPAYKDLLKEYQVSTIKGSQTATRLLEIDAEHLQRAASLSTRPALMIPLHPGATLSPVPQFD